MSIQIAVLSFPGSNNEIESLRAIERCGMTALFFRWNDDIAKLSDVDGYFIPGGFSYEDRGRAGMVAGRDPLISHLKGESEKGKVIIGNCNGAQVLVESGLIPLDKGLYMSLARNVLGTNAVGFLNEWVWITPSCSKDRCATSNWEGAIHLPIAHGEGRFTTNDKDVITELKRNNQIAFSYCDKDGQVSEDSIVTPNGSMFAIAGICNPRGNVIALMPHPERTADGDPYFNSMRQWIEKGTRAEDTAEFQSSASLMHLEERSMRPVEIFIDTIIVNNEERTVERAAKRVASSVELKQLKYLAPDGKEPREVLSHLSLFNPNKETAYIRRGGEVLRWNSDDKTEEKMSSNPLMSDTLLLRRDLPDTGGAFLGGESQTGVCYACKNIHSVDLEKRELLEIFSNPHSSVLEKLPV